VQQSPYFQKKGGKAYLSTGCVMETVMLDYAVKAILYDAAESEHE
jgi:hypothetical protein